MSTKTTLRVVPRMEYNPYSRKWEAVLFLLDIPADHGHIASYVSNVHDESSLPYYRKNTRMPKVREEKDECQALVNEYRTLSSKQPVKVVERCRITAQDLRKIWSAAE